MGKFDGVLLASDYDDTLYATGRYVSQENKDAIAYFMDNGGYFSVATGRAHATFAPQVLKEGLSMNAPCVLSNGAGVYDFQQDRWLHLTVLPPQAAENLRELAAVFPSLGMEFYHDDDIFVFRPNTVTQRHMERVGVQFTQRDLADMPAPFIKVIIEDDCATLERARDYVLSRFSADYEAIFSNPHLLELTCKGSHKGGMVRWIANHLGVAPDDTYCVGDNANDLPMLAVSRIPFAPANCAPAIKASGARLVADCDHHTLADIIAILDDLYA